MKSEASYGKYDAYLKFHGAIENEVTGTMHRYTTFIDGKPFRVSFDAGVQQGYGINPLDHRNTGLTSLPDVLLLSHSHLDHCGNLPLLSKEGFEGPVHGTQETLEGAHIALIDSLVIMQKQTEHSYGKNKSDLKRTLREYRKYVNQYGPAITSGKIMYEPTISDSIEQLLRKGRTRGNTLLITSDDTLDYKDRFHKYNYELKRYKIKTPGDIDNLDIENSHLPFDAKDIARIVSHFEPVPLEKEILLKKGYDNRLSAIFTEAGHILGSTQVVLKDKRNGTIWFSGDVGRLNEQLYLPKPTIPGNTYGKIDTLIIESTYGGKSHPERNPEQQEILDLIRQTKGNILVAAFSNNRHQDFQQFFADNRDSDLADNVVLDGFTSDKFTHLFQKHGSNFYTNLEHPAFTRAQGKGTEKAEKYLRHGSKTIVITSSGMMNGGAVETYMNSVLQDPNSLLIITGYQASGSRGEQILKTGKYKLNGITYDVKCNVYQCKTFSSHADTNELQTIIQSINSDLTYLVHGEMTSKLILQNFILTEGLSKQVCIPVAKGIKHPIGNK